MSKIIHSPKLDTIRMVENAIKKAKTYPSTNQLSRTLERQVQYTTLKTILKYLEESNKIMFDKDGSIIWIFAGNAKSKKLLSSATRYR